MEEGMIWNTYFKHRKKELREKFPLYGRRSKSTRLLTYLMVRTILGDGLHYYILSENKDYIPIEPYDFFSHYFVEKICYEFPSEDMAKWTIKCYCRKQPCSYPIVEVPRLKFWFCIKYWSPKEVCDFIEILPQFFDKWSKEIWTINHEIPKIKKMREIKRLRLELLGKREIESRYQGRFELDEEEVAVTVPLSDEYELTVRTDFVYYIPDWWERTLEIVDTFVEYFECHDDWYWMPDIGRLICVDENRWFHVYYKCDIPEDIKALTANKRKWLKLMPLSVEINLIN